MGKGLSSLGIYLSACLYLHIFKYWGLAKDFALAKHLKFITIIQQASLAAQLVKNLPAMQETGVQFLGHEDPLEKEMATYSSILVWRISLTEEPGRLQSMGS